jgi:hypothetical protein
MRDGGVAQTVEGLPSQYETVRLNPSIAKKRDDLINIKFKFFF